MPKVIQLVKDIGGGKRDKNKEEKDQQILSLDLHETMFPRYLYFAEDQKQFSSSKLK